jgi:dihydrofolate reductase
VRKVIVSTYTSVDGVFENPGWSSPYWSDEAQRYARELLWASDALLLGRKTYELFASSWPTEAWIDREDEFAVRMNAYPKHVASTSLTEPLEWSASTLLHGDPADAVAALKQQPGGNILMYSSVELMRTLMRHGLIDELRIWIHPLILGSGRRLFSDGGAESRLRLLDTTTLPNGIIVLGYDTAA